MRIDEQLFIDYCKKSSKIIDVGAQRGEFVNHANDSMRYGTIYALEPDPKYIQTLQLIKPVNNNKIEILPIAAGSKKQKHKLYNQGTGCMVDINVKKNEKFVEIDVNTLDNLFPFEVDFIKIDVEAYEYEVLLGAETHLKRGTPFYVEIHDKWLKEIGKSKEDIISLFNNYGYKENFLLRPSHQINYADLYYYIFTK